MLFSDPDDFPAINDGGALPAALDYRGFRAQRFHRQEAPEASSFTPYDADEDEKPAAARHPLSIAKARMRGAREKLLSDCEHKPESLAPYRGHVLRMLAIPDHLAPQPAWWKTLGLGLVASVAPSRWSLAWLRLRLKGIRCFEGRALVFRSSWGALIWPVKYEPAIDFIVRHVRGPAKDLHLRDLELKSAGWLQALWQLGARSVAELRAKASFVSDSGARELIALLVAEGILVSMEELDGWPQPDHFAAARYYYHRQDLDDFKRAGRRVIRKLVKLGAQRRDVLLSCHGELVFRPERLAVNVFALQCRAVPPEAALASAGKLLWMATIERWVFLLDALNVRQPADFAKFVKLLRGHGDLPVELARALVARGPTIDELAACESVLQRVGASREPEVAVRALKLLSDAPFRFSVGDFAKVDRFLNNSEKLGAFLEPLARHGLVAPSAVLCFDECFGAVSSTLLGSLLDLAMPRRGQHPIGAVADWVRRANAFSVRSLEALVELLELDDLSELERVLKLAALEAPVLRYLVRDKGLTTLTLLSNWYHDAANGVLEMKLHSELGPVELLLLDDAFQRKNFAPVRHNVSCAYAAQRRRVRAVIGERPDYDDHEACQAYDRKFEDAADAQLLRLLADMQALLAHTGGVLFASFLSEVDDDPNALAHRLAQVSPLIDELAAGRGPSGKELSDLEVEAIALVYRSNPTTVADLWRNVVGREGDLCGLILDEAYPMVWQQSRRELRPNAKLDERGFSALSKVARLASAFGQLIETDAHAACKGLRPTRMVDDAADVSGMAWHLAVLCGLALSDTHVAAAVGRWETAHSAMAGGPEAFRLIEQLQSFFGITLPDALRDQVPSKLQALSDETAGFLATRLRPVDPAPEDSAAKQCLAESIAATSDKVLKLYLHWCKVQRDQFKPVKDVTSQTALTARVLKSPAAFFAKDAAALCTRYDTDMWNEARHSHLVAFDMAKRRIAGMALLYVEPVPQIDGDRATLVIRAINPMEELASAHDLAHVVDSFLAIAVGIARRNNLAAVALPGGDRHLLSNVHQVEQEIAGRFTSATRMSGAFSTDAPSGMLKPLWRVEASFEGYARGRGSVGSLYVAWRPDSKPPVDGPRA